MTRGQQVAHTTNLRELKGVTARSIPVNFVPALNAARAASPADNVETKTHLQEAAVLPHIADIHRHGVSGFSDAGATSSRDLAGQAQSTPADKKKNKFKGAEFFRL